MVSSGSRDTSSNLLLASVSVTAAPTPATPTLARARAAASTRPGQAATSAPRAFTASPRPGCRAAAASAPPARGTLPRPAAANPPAASCAGAGKEEKNICMRYEKYFSCREGYTGPRCERCAHGYYGDPGAAGGECLPCACNQDGSTSQQCDAASGQCFCVPGNQGLQP